VVGGKTAGCERARLLNALSPYSRSIAFDGRLQCLSESYLPWGEHARALG